MHVPLTFRGDMGLALALFVERATGWPPKTQIAARQPKTAARMANELIRNRLRSGVALRALWGWVDQHLPPQKQKK